MKLTKSMNRSDWLQWRSKGIGASDVSSIIGINPWKTRYQLFLEKSGLEKPKYETNYAIEFGIKMEPYARAAFEITEGKDFPPENFQSDDHEFMRCSLDGWNEETKTALEIKCPGKSVYESTKSGKIPDYYRTQVAFQRMVTNADKVIFYVYYVPDKDMPQKGLVAKLTYTKDEAFESMIKDETIKFWKALQLNDIPEPGEKDVVKIHMDEYLAQYMNEWEDLHKAQNEIDVKMDLLKGKIKDYVKHSRVQYKNYTITKSWRKGNIDYAKVPEIAGIDLEKYRKKPSCTFAIRKLKESM